MANCNLTQAKNAKNDEFYTQWMDIQREVQAYLDYAPNVFRGKTVLCPCDDPRRSNFTKYFALNFHKYGLKKLISTSFAVESKSCKENDQPTLVERNAPQFDKDKTCIRGKIFVLDSDVNRDGVINIDDLQWDYLQGNGDFRSEEVTKLHAEVDVVVTNPPFSLFREFLAWIMDANKQFLVIGNMNAITYKEIFPLIKENKIWLGSDKSRAITYTRLDGTTQKMGNTCWFTNLDHGRRHQPLSLMTMADRLKHSRHREIRGKAAYVKYENYDAIEVPFTDAIPSDYDGVMGVPISFLDKYCPEQFEIVGMCENIDLYRLKTKVYSTSECQQAYFDKFRKKGTYDLNASGVISKEGLLEKVYQRILIRKKEE